MKKVLNLIYTIILYLALAIGTILTVLIIVANIDWILAGLFSIGLLLYCIHNLLDKNK